MATHVGGAARGSSSDGRCCDVCTASRAGADASGTAGIHGPPTAHSAPERTESLLCFVRWMLLRECLRFTACSTPQRPLRVVSLPVSHCMLCEKCCGYSHSARLCSSVTAAVSPLSPCVNGEQSHWQASAPRPRFRFDPDRECVVWQARREELARVRRVQLDGDRRVAGRVMMHWLLLLHGQRALTAAAGLRCRVILRQSRA
jgi:hypothetical protein